MKKFLIFLLVTALLAGGIFVGYKVLNDKDTAKNEIETTLSITCKKLSEDLEKIKEEVRPIVPKDGYIMKAKTIKSNESDTVLEILQKATKDNKIQIDVAGSADFAYVNGIGNIYSKDAGEMSGWSFKINDKFAEIGADTYVPKNGDVIEWIYLIDFEDMT